MTTDYRDVFDLIPIPATLIDGDGRIADVNQAFLDRARRRGVPLRREDRIGRHVTEFVSSAQERRRFSAFVERLLKGRYDQRLLWEEEREDGRPLYCEISARVTARDGRVTGALILRQDVTDRVQRTQRQDLARQLRDEIWRMGGAADMEPILVAVRDGLKRFGMPFNDCGVNLVDTDTTPPTVHTHSMTEEGRWLETAWRAEDPLFEIWQRGQVAYRPDLRDEDPFDEAAWLAGAYGRPVRCVIDVPFSRGTLAVNSVRARAFTEADVEILTEMAQVLGEGFDRMADLEALHQGEERYRAAVRQIGEAILLVELPSQRILETNPACQALLHYSGDELARLTTYDIMAHDRESIDRNGRKVLEQGEHVVGERQCRRRDGALVDVEVSLSRITYGGRQVACAVVRDITQRKRLERRRLALQRLRDEVWQMQTGTDIGKVVDLARQGLADMGVAFDHFGINVIQEQERTPVRVYTRDLAQGFVSPPRTPAPLNIVVNWWREGRPVYRADLEAQDPFGEREVLRAAYGGPVRAVLDVPFSHGTVAINSTAAHAFSDQDIEAVEALAEALSEGFRRTEDLARLAASRERLLVTLRSLADGVIAADAQGTVELLNAAAESLTGWPQAEALGRRLAEVYRTLDPVTGQAVDLPPPPAPAEAGPAARRDAILVARDGSRRLVADSSAPLRDEQGRVRGVVLVFQDVSDVRRAQQEVARTEKLRSLGVLAGGIAHDFNNILTGITGNLSLIRAELGEPPQELAELIDGAVKASRRASQLTEQLLTFARGGAPVRRSLRAAETIRDAATFALRGSDVDCHFDVAEDLWTVRADPGQLAQVIQNLVLNADQAMPKGGRLFLSARNAEVAEGEGFPPGCYVRLEVRDEGQGIAAADLERIFEPYFTTKETGSGLGLATTYAIVHNHGGHIAVTSRAGAGAAFVIHLPAEAASGPAPEADEPVDPALIGQGRVLVMDDEQLIRDLLARLLTRLGYRPVLTSHGQQAVEAYRRALEDGDPFAAVILDLTVPGGMGGAETVTQLQCLDGGVRAVVSSGYSSDPVMADFAAHGFRGVVRKPYRAQDMARVLAEVIASP